MSEAREDRDGRAGGVTMMQVILRLTLNTAAFAAVRPTLLFKPLRGGSEMTCSVVALVFRWR